MIYIISGHHNADSGAIGNGKKESDLTKIVRDLIYTRIKQINPKAFVSKDDDKDTLSQVIAKIKPKITDTDILLDIHYNSASTMATGTECIVSNNASKSSLELAAKICDTTSAITGLKNRGVKPESMSARGKLGILNMKGTAVIWELGFINNADDLKKIDDNLHWLCEDIAHILLQH